MRPLVLLAVLAVLGACSSSPEWVSTSEGSLCTFDARGRAEGWPVDVVIVVDDSPSVQPSRAMLRKRTLDALGRLVTERVLDDPMSLPAVHDLHVLVRGVSTSYERRVTYLANTPDNAWTTPDGEPRDTVTFLAACESALDDVPEGTENTPFVARIEDLRWGDGFLRNGRVVVLFATAHDDTSGSAPFRLWEGEYASAVDLGVLVDARLLGSSTPSGPRSCGTISRSLSGWDPTRTPVPRLAALVDKHDWAELTLVCSDLQEPGDLLFQRDELTFHDYECVSPLPAECTLLIAPPVSGDDARCERPELGLRPATATERRYAESQLDPSLLHDRPLCHLAQLASGGGPDEGWYWPADACVPHYTAWAQPVGGSYLLLHCAGPTCDR